MKHIKLDKNHVGKYTDGKETLNICEDLEFEVDYKFDKNAEVYFVANNGIINRKGRIVDNKFSIPCEFLKLGDLQLKIIVAKSNSVEEFRVENLIIMGENGEFKSIPEIVEMQNRIDNYSKLVENLERKNEILTKLVGGLYDADIDEGGEND